MKKLIYILLIVPFLTIGQNNPISIDKTSCVSQSLDCQEVQNCITSDFVNALVIHPAGGVPCADIALLESDNNVSEGEFNRAGDIGTSEQYARCDHQHPIVRIPNPGDPVITLSGNATLGQTAILRRWSNEEAYKYQFRTIVTFPATNGSRYLNIPNIAGFQRPEIDVQGTYRTTSRSPQKDDNGNSVRDGAMPNGPFWGHEASNWAGTERIYLGPTRIEDTYQMYTTYKVTYTRL